MTTAGIGCDHQGAESCPETKESVSRESAHHVWHLRLSCRYETAARIVLRIVTNVCKVPTNEPFTRHDETSDLRKVTSNTHTASEYAHRYAKARRGTPSRVASNIRLTRGSGCLPVARRRPGTVIPTASAHRPCTSGLQGCGVKRFRPTPPPGPRSHPPSSVILIPQVKDDKRVGCAQPDNCPVTDHRG